jgi:hypothetical protein
MPGSAFEPLREYLPQAQSGSMLITMRSREMALKLVGQRDIVYVEPMDKPHALTLFERKFGVWEDSSDIVELAVALEYMPLVVVYAVVYIFQRAPRCFATQYLDDFRKSDERKTSPDQHSQPRGDVQESRLTGGGGRAVLQAMETHKKKLGADLPDTLISMTNLAFTWKE